MSMEQMMDIFGSNTLSTIVLTLGSTVLAYLIGMPLGIILILTDKDGIHPNRVINSVLGVVVNILRSIPFLILAMWMLPVTRTVVGTTVGDKGVLLPLVVAAAPFVARMVESSIKEVDHGIIEAAQSMGAPTSKIITKVMLGEAMPSLLVGFCITVTTILGYTAMAGFLGGGGLGMVAVNYGFYKYQSDIMTIAVILLVLLVQIFQEIGMRLSKHLDKRL